MEKLQIDRIFLNYQTKIYDIIICQNKPYVIVAQIPHKDRDIYIDYVLSYNDMLKYIINLKKLLHYLYKIYHNNSYINNIGVIATLHSLNNYFLINPGVSDYTDSQEFNFFIYDRTKENLVILLKKLYETINSLKMKCYENMYHS